MRSLWVALVGLSTALTIVPVAGHEAPSAASSALTIQASSARAVSGTQIVVSGVLTSGTEPLADQRVVLVARDDRTGSAFHVQAGATTVQGGRYRFEFGASRHLVFYVSFAGSADRGAARSSTLTLRVVGRVAITVSPAQPTDVVAGEVRQFSTLLPRESIGKDVLIQTLRSGRWTTVARTPVIARDLSPRSVGYLRWSYRFSQAGRLSLRFVVPATSQQEAGVSRNLSFVVFRWHLLTDLDPSAVSGVSVGKTDGRLGTTEFPDSVKLTRSASAGSVSYDLRGGCSRFLGMPVVYRGQPRSHLVRFIIRTDGQSVFDITASFDKQYQGPVLGDITDRQTLQLFVGGPGTGTVDLWSGAQVLCSW